MFCSVALHIFGECSSSSFKPQCSSLCLPSLCILIWFWFSSCRHCAPLLSALSPLSPLFFFLFLPFSVLVSSACSDRDLCVYGRQDRDEHMTFRSCRTETTHVWFCCVLFLQGNPWISPIRTSQAPRTLTGESTVPARPTVSVKK